MAAGRRGLEPWAAIASFKSGKGILSLAVISSWEISWLGLWENPMHCPTSFHQKCISDTQRSPDKMFSLLQICGVPGNHSCAAAACGGGPNCSGALPLSSSAFRKAEETAVLLTNLTTQLQDPENQVCVSKLHLFSATHGGWETGQSIPGKHRSWEVSQL